MSGYEPNSIPFTSWISELELICDEHDIDPPPEENWERYWADDLSPMETLTCYHGRDYMRQKGVPS